MKIDAQHPDPRSPLLSPVEVIHSDGNWQQSWADCVSREGYLLLRGTWARGKDGQSPVGSITLTVSQHHRDWRATFAVHEGASRELVIGFYTDGSSWRLTLEASGFDRQAATIRLSALEAFIAVVDVHEIPDAYDFSALTQPASNVPFALFNANQGGLMNRLVSLFAAIDMGKRLGCRVGCWWAPNAHCAAKFADLFDLEASGVLAASHQPVTTDFSFYYNYLPDEPPLALSVGGGGTRIVHSTSLLRTDIAPPSRWEDVGEVFRRLKLSAPIRRKLAAFQGTDFSRTIGFHIRRPYPNGAFAREEQAKFGLSEQVFVNLLDDLRAHNPEFERVLLCTNDPALERRLAERFPDYIFGFAKQSIDNTTDPLAVQEALVDVMLLARCPILFSQSMSSFAVVASCIGQSRLFCLTPETQEDLYNFWRFDVGQHNHNMTTSRGEFGEIAEQIVEWTVLRKAPPDIC